MRPIVFTVLACLLAWGCGKDSGSAPQVTTTYHRDVAPLLAQTCTTVPIEAGDCKDAWAGRGVGVSERGER